VVFADGHVPSRCVTPSFGTIIVSDPPLAVATKESPVVGAEWPHPPVEVHPDVAAMLCVPFPVIVNVHGCADVAAYVALALLNCGEKLLLVLSARVPTTAGV
jgi:hypothetical protein